MSVHYFNRKMQKLSLFIVGLTFISIIATFGEGQSQPGVYERAYAGKEFLSKLLEYEIARDQTLVSSQMNIQRLKMVRKRLLKDIGPKESAIENVMDGGGERFFAVMEVLKKTLLNERTIAQTGRIGESVRVRTKRLLRSGLKKKRDALESLK